MDYFNVDFPTLVLVEVIHEWVTEAFQDSRSMTTKVDSLTPILCGSLLELPQ
jgi:hypothetical protein